MSKEVWKSIDGYSGMYQVSNMGRVRSWKRHRGYPGKRDESKILSSGRSKGHYLSVALLNNGTQKTRKVHRLVAANFVPNPDSKKCVNHLNGIKTDNRASNLSWCTYSENSKHATRIGLNTMPNIRGANNPNSSLTMENVEDIRFLSKKYSGKRLAKMFGVSESNISSILNNKTWVSHEQL